MLNNLGLLPSVSLNWMAALQLWPLLLVLIGVNIVVQQAPRPLGGFLSALVGVTAVAIFGYVLLFSQDNPRLAGLGLQTNPAEIQTRQISFTADDIQSADVELDLGMAGAAVSALEDSANLIEGQVSYVGDLTFDASQSGSRANIYLSEKNSGLWWLNPSSWASGGLEKWQIGLNPGVVLDLRLDVGAGSATLDLRELSLRQVDVDGGAGSMELFLPDGDYDGVVDVGAGATRMTLAENGRQQITIDGGAGSLTIFLPANREAQITVNDGAGSFTINSSRFNQLDGRPDGNGVWQTADYGRAANALDLSIDVGAGSVTVREQ
ncbi:MAG: hypothetical protein IPM39_17810 [Chloroflexi bacterium]|nr:hypothetical protein [Chloroflexota bacterium]